MADGAQELSDRLKTILRRLGPELESIMQQADTDIGAIAVGRYMRDAGAEAGRDGGLPPNRTNTLRIVSGTIARSLTGARTDRSAPDRISRIERIGNRIRLTKGSSVDYARTHEKGFEGVVTVPAHTRNVNGRSVDVRQHTRRMDVQARPYLQPAADDYSGRFARMTEEDLPSMIRRSAEGR